MKPFIRAQLSAKKFGGKPEDYLDIHHEMDISKSCLADVRHRAICPKISRPKGVDKRLSLC